MDLKNRRHQLGDRVLDGKDVKEVINVTEHGFNLERTPHFIPWDLQSSYPLLMIPNKNVDHDGDDLRLYMEFEKEKLIEGIKATGSAMAHSLNSYPDRQKIFYKEPKTFVDVQEKNQTFGEAMANFDKGWGIKVSEWEGYWFRKGGEIWVMLADGSTSNTPWYHQNVLRQDWQSGPIKPVFLTREVIEALSK